MAADYKQKTIKLTGMTPKEYRAEYTRFAARVRNFKQATGVSNVSTAREFYLAKKYPSSVSETTRAILSFPATRAKSAGSAPKISKAANQQAISYVENRWSGRVSTTPGAVVRVLDELKAGKITAKEATERLTKWAEANRLKRETDPAFGYGDEA